MAYQTDLIVQSTFSRRPDEAYLGMLASPLEPYRGGARVAAGKIQAGYGVFKTPTGARGNRDVYSGGNAFHLLNNPAAADVDAIKGATATSATDQTILASQADGVIAGRPVYPPRKITITRSSHANFDAVTAVLKFIDDTGRLITENVVWADAGNDTLTSSARASEFVSLFVPAQAGTGGSYTIGHAAMDALVIGDYLGVARRQVAKQAYANGALWTAPADGVEASYLPGESLPVLKMGDIWVYSEEAIFDQDPVYVRVAAGGAGSVLGAFRNDSDSSSCVLVPGAKFCRNSGGAGVAWASFLG